MVDPKVLARMARSAARAADRAALSQGDGRQDCAGYRAYLEEYNHLVKQAAGLFPNEVNQLFYAFDMSKIPDVHGATRLHWRHYLDQAIVVLNKLAVYPEDKAGLVEHELIQVSDLIEATLRASMFDEPKREQEVSNQLEVLFKGRGLNYRRETIGIEYSSKTFFPDFVIDPLDLAVETKLCATNKREKEIVEEINADIPAYHTKYSNILFVVYDLGYIRDVARFKSGIESIVGVRISVIKH